MKTVNNLINKFVMDGKTEIKRDCKRLKVTWGNKRLGFGENHERPVM